MIQRKEKATVIHLEPQSISQINFQDYHFDSDESLSDSLFESSSTSGVSSTSFASTSSAFPSTYLGTQSTSTAPDAKNDNKKKILSKKSSISKRRLNNQKKKLVAPNQ